MKKYMNLYLAVLVVIIYFAFLNRGWFVYFDPAWAWLLLCFSLWGLRSALSAGLLAGLLMDMHFVAFGRYLLIYPLALVVLYLVQRFLIAGQTAGRRWLLYWLATLALYGLLFIASGLAHGFNYISWSGAVWILLLLSSLVLTGLTIGFYYFLHHRLRPV